MSASPVRSAHRRCALRAVALALFSMLVVAGPAVADGAPTITANPITDARGPVAAEGGKWEYFTMSGVVDPDGTEGDWGFDFSTRPDLNPYEPTGRGGSKVLGGQCLGTPHIGLLFGNQYESGHQYQYGARPVSCQVRHELSWVEEATRTMYVRAFYKHSSFSFAAGHRSGIVYGPIQQFRLPVLPRPVSRDPALEKKCKSTTRALKKAKSSLAKLKKTYKKKHSAKNRKRVKKATKTYKTANARVKKACPKGTR